MKTCRLCGQVKDLARFHRNAKMRDGHFNECVDCTTAGDELPLTEMHLVGGGRLRVQLEALELVELLWGMVPEAFAP